MDVAIPAGDVDFFGNIAVLCLCSDHRVVEMPARDVVIFCEIYAGTPRPLRLPEHRLTSVPAISGTPYVPFLAKVMPNFFVKFGMTLLKIGHMGYCD